MKLLNHFKRMQEMAAQFVTPEPYQGFTPGNNATIVGDQAEDNRRFAHDMIYMLDGPEQRAAQAEAELWAEQGYPTEDAYLSACRALHWRTEQLRQAGIEPLDLDNVMLGTPCQPGETLPLPHYPPEGYRFPITEAFPGDDHRQLYHGWRRYPRAMRATVTAGILLGIVIMAAVWLLIHATHVACIPTQSALSLC